MKYSASFTAGSLLLDEISSIIDIIGENRLDDEKKDIISNNLIKINSESSRKRVLSEINKRVKSVPSRIWEEFKTCNEAHKKIILFYVCLKTYEILFDFQNEIIKEKYRSLSYDVDYNDVDLFLSKKSNTHPEIDKWTNSTKEKIIRTILLILNQAQLIKDKKIVKLEAPDSFWRLFVEVGDEWFLEMSLLNKSERDRILGV